MSESERGESVSLEQRLARVERIVEALGSERLELEEALGLFEEGVAHLRASEALLRETELRVERLVSESGDTVADGPGID